MRLLEVVPGVTFYDVLMRGWADESHLLIGRSSPLSADKSATHFPLLWKVCVARPAAAMDHTED
jgi:magnesium-dependent phosphatase 1